MDGGLSSGYDTYMPQKHPIRHTGRSKPQQCSGKNCYMTRDDAELVRREQELLTPHLSLAIYHCMTCRSYHLTRRAQTDKN